MDEVRSGAYALKHLQVGADGVISRYHNERLKFFGESGWYSGAMLRP